METQMQSDLLDRDATSRFFGGSRPLNAATLYQGVRKGRSQTCKGWTRIEPMAAI